LQRVLHIIAHDVPYPLDYGGVFDLYCKLPALQQQGIDIIYHCFDYGRGRQPELNKYCREVYYYCRQEGHKGFSARQPYIVSSRTNEELFKNLLKDNHPILAEGVHCTALMQQPLLAKRKIILRLHNVEFEYYRQLYKHSKRPFKKAYYYHESRLLKKYEEQLAHQLPVIAVAQKDVATYKKAFNAPHINYLPVFIPWQEVKAPEGMGNFCLYHGNLSIAENEKAAIWLTEEVFKDLKIPFVIAGKNPSSRLAKLAHKQSHTCLVANPADDEMRDLVAKAQVNILPSFNETGIKLKLLNALFNGRHCVVNNAAVEQSGLAPACHIAETATALQHTITQLYYLQFGKEEKKIREKILLQQYNNAANASKLIAWIW
jgi:glycosyltransferase involved in cell wall biosynthesis